MELKRFNKIAMSLLLLSVLIGGVWAAVIWSSEPIQRTIVIEWGDAISLDVSDVLNYESQTEAVSIQEFPDARSDAFGLVLLENRVEDDLVLNVDVTGVPEGATVTLKYSWVCYQKRIEDDSTYKVTAFNDAGDAQLILVDEAYSDVDTSSFTAISGSGVNLSNVFLSRMTYSAPETLNVPTVDDANALWVYVDLDLSGVSGYGEWSLGLVASLAEV